MKNNFKGGMSENMSAFDVAKKWKINPIEFIPILEKGTKHEMEHTDDKDIARRIALDHLVERVDYYDMLDKIEKMHLGGDMSKHLAPNGKPSNLTHEQWHLVRTPEFKAWFGDWEKDPENASKVVDKNGEPMVVYHATHAKFNEFSIISKYYNLRSKKNWSIGSHFGNLAQSKSIAEGMDWIKINEYFLNIRNLERVFDYQTWTSNDWQKNLIELGYIKEKKTDYTFDEILRVIQKNKLDGFVYKNRYEGGGDSYVVLNPNQIKLADGSNRTFDGDNPDIRFDKGGLVAPNGKPSNLTDEQWKLVRTPEFKAWFGDWENEPENASKVVDENGEPLVVYHGTYVENPFDVFDFDKADLGFHFGNYQQAKNRVETKKSILHRKKQSIINPYFLNIKTLFNASDIGEWQYPQRYIDMIVDENIITEDEAKTNGFFTTYYPDDNKAIRDFIINKHGVNVGFVYDNKYEGDGQSFIVLKESQIKLADGTNTTFNGGNPDIRFDKGGRTIAQTPAPASDRVFGSKNNPKGSASDSELAKTIKFNESLLKAIENKVKAHNEEYPTKKVSIPTAKAVVRRGMGAYSKSHRPFITGGAPNTRQAWGLARLNKFLLKKRGVKVKRAYIQDDDLL